MVKLLELMEVMILNNISIHDIEKYLKQLDSTINLYVIDKIIFKESVKLNCFYCENYNKKWTCPPRIPDFNYAKIISEYYNKIVIEYTANIDDDTFENVRYKSTNHVHSILLKLEKYLWDNDYPMAVSFIGGGCKLCKNGCSENNCRNKSVSRIPIEATGISVIETLKEIDIHMTFIITSNFKRYGMLLW